MDIAKTSGSCENTLYTLTPIQNITKCAGFFPPHPSPLFQKEFENPLTGTTKEVTVQLDTDSPVVECGFLPQVNKNNIIDSNDSKTLYSYVSKTNIGDGTRLNDARLYYYISVSKLCCIIVF